MIQFLLSSLAERLILLRRVLISDSGVVGRELMRSKVEEVRYGLREELNFSGKEEEVAEERELMNKVVELSRSGMEYSL